VPVSRTEVDHTVISSFDYGYTEGDVLPFVPFLSAEGDVVPFDAVRGTPISGSKVLSTAFSCLFFCGRA